MRKKDPKSQIKVRKTSKKHVKLVEMPDFSIQGVHIQDFAQTQQNCAQSHNCMTTTFGNSARQYYIKVNYVLYELIISYVMDNTIQKSQNQLSEVFICYKCIEIPN